MVWFAIVGWAFRVLGTLLPLWGLLGLYRRARWRSETLDRTDLPMNHPEALHMGHMDVLVPTLIADMRDAPKTVRRDFLRIGAGIVLTFAGDMLLTFA